MKCVLRETLRNENQLLLISRIMWKEKGRKKGKILFEIDENSYFVKTFQFFSYIYIFWMLFTIIDKYRWSGLKYTLYERLMIN